MVWRGWVGFPTFFCASFFPFFALSTPAFPRQFSSAKSCISGTSDLLFLVEKRQPPGAGFWGRFWTGSPTGKKGKSFFSGAGKKVSFAFVKHHWKVLASIRDDSELETHYPHVYKKWCLTGKSFLGTNFPKTFLIYTGFRFCQINFDSYRIEPSHTNFSFAP